MFQCIANCWRGWAQFSITIVTDLAFNVYWDPYVQACAMLNGVDQKKQYDIFAPKLTGMEQRRKVVLRSK